MVTVIMSAYDSIDFNIAFRKSSWLSNMLPVHQLLLPGFQNKSHFSKNLRTPHEAELTRYQQEHFFVPQQQTPWYWLWPVRECLNNHPTPLRVLRYCQNITTGNTEKKIYFKKLTKILLPPLCPQFYSLFFTLLVFTPAKIISSLPLRSALQKSSVLKPSYATNRI